VEGGPPVSTIAQPVANQMVTQLSPSRPPVQEKSMPLPRKDSPKKFDKKWFKEGGPKRYGQVTVYIDRTIGKYRIKPHPATRYDEGVMWGKGEKAQQKQWKKVIEKIGKYK